MAFIYFTVPSNQSDTPVVSTLCGSYFHSTLSVDSSLVMARTIIFLEGDEKS